MEAVNSSNESAMTISRLSLIMVVIFIISKFTGKYSQNYTMTEAERIEYLIKHLEGGSGQKFAERVGISTTAIHRIRKGDYGIRLKIDAILRAYPAINRRWLETGEGYPGDLTIDLVKAHYQERIEKADKVIDHLMRRIEDLENVLQNGTKG